MSTRPIYLLRHASPDWSRKDIPYDIPPGPPLSKKGEQEAVQLAEFLQAHHVVKLYYSPFERTAKTAHIICRANQIFCIEEPRLAEWRGEYESQEQATARMKAVFEAAFMESERLGPIGLVSHGGPIGALLQELGIDEGDLATYRTKFDTTNPLPPAGAWEAEWDEASGSWSLDLKFIPSV